MLEMLERSLCCVVLVWIAAAPMQCFSQSTRHVDKMANITVGIAKNQGTASLSYAHIWRIGRRHKLGIGVGGRLTSYVASNQYYVTAPAQLTSGSASPLIIFKNNITANIDSFRIASPQLHSLNASIHIDYQLTKRLGAGFNIDAIGTSFGGTRNGTFIHGSATARTDAHPTAFNILLISDNDRGSLNSEFYVRYFLNVRWGLKIGGQFLFTEYTTTTNVQSVPQPNDRFRNKSLLLCIGVSYRGVFFHRSPRRI